MKTVLFHTAVVLAIVEIRAKQPNGFSVHDVTKYLRNQVNNFEIALSDGTTEDVDGVDTYRIEHNDVKAIFNELFENGALVGLDRRHARGHFEYFNVPSAPAIVSLKATPSLSTAIQTTIARNTVAGPAEKQLRAYLDNHSAGSQVTLKQLQSRFKGIHLTCKDYALLVESFGYSVDKTDLYPSWWTVNI